jgi:hypothetical protein
LATFIINGIDEIADSEIMKKEGTTKPKVTLSFELSRSGILLLNKAEAKVDETYYVDAPTNKTKKVKVTQNETADNTTTESSEST